MYGLAGLWWWWCGEEIGLVKDVPARRPRSVGNTVSGMPSVPAGHRVHRVCSDSSLVSRRARCRAREISSGFVALLIVYADLVEQRRSLRRGLASSCCPSLLISVQTPSVANAIFVCLSSQMARVAKFCPLQAWSAIFEIRECTMMVIKPSHLDKIWAGTVTVIAESRHNLHKPQPAQEAARSPSRGWLSTWDQPA